jgi:oligo-alginate lyase
MVDGQNTRPGLGKTTLWADGKRCRIVRAAGPQLAGAQQYDRTVAMIDLSDDDFYVLDVFRVVGGREHTKLTSSHFGQITPIGLSLADAENPGLSGQLRAFRKAAPSPPVWAVDWTVEDRWKYLPPGSDIQLRYTDLTPGAEVFTAEAWVSPGMYGGTDQAWVPRVIVRRRTQQAPLRSTFVSVIEPYEKHSKIAAVRRLPLETAEGKPCGESHVAVEVRLADGRRDVLIALDSGSAPTATASAVGLVVQKETGVRLDGQFGWIRFDASGKLQHAAVCCGKSLEVAGLVVCPENVESWKEL